MIAVAIDGPGGAGKSTIARTAAKELQFIYIDTGALYRSIGYYVCSKGLDTTVESDVEACLTEIKIEIRFIDSVQHVFVNDEDVSDKIRTPQISMAASNVAKITKVREFLVDLQRDFAKTNNVIMDGRDIGTVVLPNAELKIFLTASAEARANRRYKELIEKGEAVEYNDILEDLKQRDYQDSHREIAPLKQAEDAILVDTSELTLQESIDKVLSLIKQAIESDNDNKDNSVNKSSSFKNDSSGLDFKIKTGINKFVAVLRVLLWPIYRIFFWYSVEGKENLPKNGGYIFCANHIAALDPICWVLVHNRRVHFMAKEELFKNKFCGMFLRMVDVFAIKRGAKDMSSLNFAVDIVKNGEILGIYPEGTRSKDGKPKRAKSGVAFLANATGADVVPAALVMKKNKKFGIFRRFKLIIGKPIPASELKFDENSKDNLKRVSTHIMNKIVELWENNQF